MHQGDLLTDDELVALCVDAGARWPGPLPSVNVEDPEELELCAQRGLRSLVVRGALSSEGELTATLSSLRAEVTGGSLQACLYQGDSQGAPTSWIGAVVCFATAGGWILDHLLPGGIHEILHADAEELPDFLAGALLAAQTSGGDGVAVWLSVAVEGGGSQLFSPQPDQFVRLHATSDGRVDQGSPVGTDSLLEALSDLLAAGTRTGPN